MSLGISPLTALRAIGIHRGPSVHEPSSAMRKGWIARDTVSVLENTEEAKGTLSTWKNPKGLQEEKEHSRR